MPKYPFLKIMKMLSDTAAGLPWNFGHGAGLVYLHVYMIIAFQVGKLLCQVVNLDFNCVGIFAYTI